MARVTCNTVDEAIDAMEKMLCPFRETVGPDDGIKWVPDEWVPIQYDGCEWRRVDDQPLQITAVEDAWFLPRNHEASDLTVESLQKAIAHMERRKLEHPGVKLTINPTHVEIPVPPGWTREMVEDMMYYQNALSEVSSLAKGPVEDQPKEGSTDDRRPKAGDIVEYEGRRHTVFCHCNSLWRGSYYGQHTFGWDDMCPDCDYHYWYEDTDDVTPPVQESSGLDSLADVLPDLYGRKEHAAYMERMAQAEREQKMEKASSLGHALDRVMDGLCGKHRGMED